MSRPEITPVVRAVPGRRGLLRVAGAALAAVTLAACGGKKTLSAENVAETVESVPERSDDEKLDWKDARERLEEGNKRFADGKPAHPDLSAKRRKSLAANGQKPFAIVLSCADSRVPPEIVFDQGLGDLFPVRSAGEVLDEAVLGSIQYAVAEIAPPLLVVLGHSKCGAVKATLEAVEKKSPPTGTSLDYLIKAITPSVKEAEELGVKKAELLEVAVHNNVERVVEELSAAKIVEVAVKTRKLKVVGAIYDLASGEVTFL